MAQNSQQQWCGDVKTQKRSGVSSREQSPVSQKRLGTYSCGEVESRKAIIGRSSSNDTMNQPMCAL